MRPDANGAADLSNTPAPAASGLLRIGVFDEDEVVPFYTTSEADNGRRGAKEEGDAGEGVVRDLVNVEYMRVWSFCVPATATAYETFLQRNLVVKLYLTSNEGKGQEYISKLSLPLHLLRNKPTHTYVARFFNSDDGSSVELTMSVGAQKGTLVHTSLLNLGRARGVFVSQRPGFFSPSPLPREWVDVGASPTSLTNASPKRGRRSPKAKKPSS